MKRSLTLLLASLLLVCSLTACGRDDKQQETNQNGSAVTDSGGTAGDQSGTGTEQGTANGSDPANGAGNGASNGTGSVMEDMGDAVTDGVNDVADGIEDVGDAITGDQTKSGTASRARGTADGML